MSAEIPPSSAEKENEVSELVRHLAETHQRLQELLGDQVDSVTSSNGRSYLLWNGQEKLRRSAEAQSSVINALREDLQLFRGMFAAAAAGIAISSPEGRFLEVNASYCNMLGYTEEELVGLDFPSITHPDDLAQNLHLRDEVLAGLRSSFVMEKRYLKKDGGIAWVRHSVSPTRSTSNKVTSFIVIAEEITQRRLLEQQSEERFKLIEMASAAAKLGIWAIEYPDNKIVWSKEVYRIHEVEPGFEPDLDSALRFFPGVSREKLQKAVLSGERYDLELDFVTAKGKKLWVRVTSAVEMRDGARHRLYGVIHDVTEQKTAEARLRRLVDSNVQGVIFWNKNGHIIQANDAFLSLTGYTRQDLEAGTLDWAAMTPSEYKHLDACALEQIGATGKCAPYEKEFISKDGTRVPVFIGSASFGDNPDEGVCFVVDLTERKKLEQQSFRNQRMESLGTLAGGIAHDLNNILAPILMSIEFLKSVTDDARIAEVLDTLMGSARRGAELVKQVLSFARGVEGERILVNVQHLVRDLVKVMHDTFPKAIALSYTSERDLWAIRGDPTQVHQVLLNLCVNARDAMPEGGKLSIQLENVVVDETYAAMNLGAIPGAFIVIEVVDTGEGIPAAIRDRIFEPFFTTKEVGKGTGLGLSTTLAIIKSHGGFVNVYSEVGKGTKFRVYLPAQTSNAAQASVVEQTPLPRGNGELVLVVDDEEPIRQVALRTLQQFGYRVLLAKHGAEAVALYAQHKKEIAVILTDMAMPIMDGPTLIIALKAMNPDVIVIGSSGLASNGGVAKAVGAGVRFFVPKPYTADAMLTMLQKALHDNGSSQG